MRGTGFGNLGEVSPRGKGEAVVLGTEVLEEAAEEANKEVQGNPASLKMTFLEMQILPVGAKHLYPL